jgi:hypothetical protein
MLGVPVLPATSQLTLVFLPCPQPHLYMYARSGSGASLN